MRSLLCAVLVVCLAAVAQARTFDVDTAAGIREAMAKAQPGDVISIKPGDYDMGKSLSTGASGTRDKPIVMRTAGDKGYAKLKIKQGTVGFRVVSKHWELRGLHIEGTRDIMDLIQVDATRGGSDLLMVDCRISNCKEFLIKSSRSREVGSDNVVLDHCEWFDVPATAIDLVCGDHWVIRGNYVHDYGKSGNVHYGIFCKGGGKFGLIENNIVDGKGGKGTVGISFGGGLTGKQWLPLVPGETDKVAAEHFQGIARNNIVVNTGDCAYHTNNGQDCKFYNNLAFNCGAGYQRQASYPPDATLVNNVLSGRLQNPGQNRDNLTRCDKAWFVDAAKMDFRLSDAGRKELADKGTVVKDADKDFFGQPRKKPALGPVNADAKESTTWTDRRK